jgi:hypothetical protein
VPGRRAVPYGKETLVNVPSVQDHPECDVRVVNRPGTAARCLTDRRLSARWPTTTVAGPTSFCFAQDMPVVQTQPLILAADQPDPDATADLAPAGGARRFKYGSAHG